jgi:preprotein translocase subunit Sec61beta
MAKLGGIHMPSSYGGLMRYSEEYKSRLMLKPTHIIVFIILIVIFVAVLKIFFPFAS